MYIVTGATGNTGHEVAAALLKAGKPVTVIGRSAERLQSLVDLGAIAAIGSLEDTDFLAHTFAGATAVYAMIPPKWDLQEDWRTFQRRMGRAIADAVQQAAVPYVVVLSSNGAQLPEGAGPVTGLHEFEQMLKAVPGLNTMSLRAGYFMQNFYGLMGMIKGMGMFGYSLHNDVKVPIVHTRDIAAVATKHLLALDFSGHQHVFVPGAADLTMDEVAVILGKAIGKPGLKYVPFSPEAARAGMIQNGIPATIADGYTELFGALNNGTYLNDYQRTPENTTPTTLEWFAEHEFGPAYAQA